MTTMADLVPRRAERTIVYGGTRAGKSSYCDWAVRHVLEERPTAMPLLFDSKPRFRAETIAYGPGLRLRKNAAKLYESWEAGPTFPNSVVFPADAWEERWASDDPFKGFYRNPGELVVLQSGSSVARPWMLRLGRKFVDMNPKRRERLLWVNEGLDFYQRNSYGVDARNDVILDAARAGGERGIGLLFESHRPKGIPPLLNTLSSRIVLFHLRFQGDMKYMYDMGIPEDEEMPDDDYAFKHFTVRPGGKISPAVLVRLKYPQWYLDQLSST
jgi:hypothetical protein